MSVMTWGEIAEGLWILNVFDNVRLNEIHFCLLLFTKATGLQVGPEGNVGFVGETFLILHGTLDLPKYMRKGPRKYNFNYNRVHNRVGFLRDNAVLDSYKGILEKK